MYSAKEAAARTGLSEAALRYYEREGLVPPVARTQQNYRRYTETDLEWVRIVCCLRRAYVPVRSIRRYVELLRRGSDTIPERRDMTAQYAAELRQRLADTQQALALVEKKLNFYDRLLTQKTVGPLTPADEWALYAQRRDG